MSVNYIFPSQKALICRWVAAFFASAAVLAVAVPFGLLVVTGDPLISWECNSASECGFRDGSLEALDEDERKQVLATPGAERTYAEHVGRGPIRFGLAAVAIASQLPFAVLLGAVAMALFGFGRGSGLGGALRWMRIVALTALVMAIWPSIIGLLAARCSCRERRMALATSSRSKQARCSYI